MSGLEGAIQSTQLDRFIETLQNFDQLSFCGVTCEGVIVLMTVREFDTIKTITPSTIMA